MTDDDLRASRAELYRRRTVEYGLRGAVLAGAEAAGVGPGDFLPEPLQRAYDSYTAEIARLDAEIAELDQKIATATEDR
jgi:transposase